MDAQPGKPQSAVEWVYQHSKHKPNIRFVLVSLAQCIDAGNSCPSHKDLTTMTGLSRDTVRRALGQLDKDGTITIIKNGGGKVKGGHKDCYQLSATVPPATSTQLVATSNQHTASSTQHPLKHETSEVPHVGTRDAAGEKDLSLKQEKDKQTDVRPPDKSDPGDGLTPEQRSVRQSFEGIFGPLSITWWNELEGLIAYYSHVFVQVVLTNAQKLRDKGETIELPMNYLRTGLSNMAAKGLIPHLAPLKSAAPVPYSPTADLSQYTRQAATAPVIHPKQRPPAQQPVIKASGNLLAQEHERRQKAERAKPYGNPV
jgi:DNA-binding transcriptional regulator YhcF (GntR family)